MAGKRATPDDVRLGERLKSLRAAAGLTQREIAAVIGVSSAQLQKYERGTNRISATDLVDVAAHLRVSVGDFFAGSAERTGEAA